MPIVELVSPGEAPGRDFLRDVSRGVTGVLGIEEGRCWVRWTRVDPAVAYRPEWERDAPPAPMVFVTCKETYGPDTVRAVLDRLTELIVAAVRCRADEVYVAIDRVAAGDLLVRGGVWTGEST